MQRTRGSQVEVSVAPTQVGTPPPSGQTVTHDPPHVMVPSVWQATPPPLEQMVTSTPPASDIGVEGEQAARTRAAAVVTIERIDAIVALPGGRTTTPRR